MFSALRVAGSARTPPPQLLRVSDVVTLHVPNMPNTLGMISAPELAAMKRGSYLINNARGELVDMDALIAALQSGQALPPSYSPSTRVPR